SWRPGTSSRRASPRGRKGTLPGIWCIRRRSRNLGYENTVARIERSEMRDRRSRLSLRSSRATAGKCRREAWMLASAPDIPTRVKSSGPPTYYLMVAILRLHFIIAAREWKARSIKVREDDVGPGSPKTKLSEDHWLIRLTKWTAAVVAGGMIGGL